MKIATLGVGRIDINKFHKTGKFSPDLNRPEFGLFGSTLIEVDGNQTTDWFEYIKKIKYDMERYSHGYEYELIPEAKILTIDTERDYVDLLSSRYRLINEMYKNKTLISLDWNKISEDFDVFHLTKQGYEKLKTLGFIFGQSKDINISNFSSYDCETWILFNLDCINDDTVKEIHIDYNE